MANSGIGYPYSNFDTIGGTTKTRVAHLSNLKPYGPKKGSERLVWNTPEKGEQRDRAEPAEEGEDDSGSNDGEREEEEEEKTATGKTTEESREKTAPRETGKKEEKKTDTKRSITTGNKHITPLGKPPSMHTYHRYPLRSLAKSPQGHEDTPNASVSGNDLNGYTTK